MAPGCKRLLFWVTFVSREFTISYPLCKEPEKGIQAAHKKIAQQLGNGAIAEKLCRGRSFFDGRARGQGSKGYVGKRDAHKKFGSGQQLLKGTVE
jgi:hypothetical protein